MAQRPIWRGHLRLALVSCPVALYTVRETGSELHFHLINPETGHRMRMVTVDAETDEEVQRQDLVKGYEFEKDRYVLLDESDFESARIDTSSTMEVETFVQNDAVDPIYFDTSYYMTPDGEAGRDVYVVLRDAIAKTRRLALSRVVLSQRERVIAISPLGAGLVAHTLHQMQDVRQADEVFSSVPHDKPDPDMVRLAVQLIDRQTGKFDPAIMQDRYEMRLREVIDAKLRGEGLQPIKREEADQGNVIDLMSALKRSLDDTGATASRRPAGSRATKPPASKPGKPPARTPGKRKAARR
ncbi:MAG: Ku protein [Rhodopila sp.]|nr:Ku protein [Rhodopila sp.]